MRLAGLVLAAGAGVRAGGPKALRLDDAGRAWVDIAASSLRDAGCLPVFVVLGAAANRARALVPRWATVVGAEDWAKGQSASLRAGLDALEALDDFDDLDDLDDLDGHSVDGVLVTLVDLPWQGAAEALAVVGLADAARPRASLARLTVRGEPGHPVLIGRDHWARLRETLHGDEGARAYLASASVRTVELAP